MEIIQQHNRSSAQSFKVDAEKINGFDILEKKLHDTLSDSSGITRSICGYLLNAGGKRIRPQLVLHSGLVFSNTSEQLVDTAVAAELIHMASLVHDDIIDESPLRRNRPSINKMWDNHSAVLCGDYLFAKAFKILANHKLSVPLGYMVDAIQNMCQGELEQANDKFNINMNLSSYYDRIMKKTAAFLKYCCMSGAYIGNADGTQIELFGEYGLNLGLAFQIIDDILDFCGRPDIIGKPVGEDLKNGDITLPFLFLLKDENHGNWARSLIVERKLTNEVIYNISQVLYNSGIIEEVYKVAGMHINKARQCLGYLPATGETKFLHEMTDMLETRMN